VSEVCLQDNQKKLTSLKLITIGGSACPPLLLEVWHVPGLEIAPGTDDKPLTACLEKVLESLCLCCRLPRCKLWLCA
jgi:hypothetical protein